MSCCSSESIPGRIAELAGMIDRLNRGAARRDDKAEADNLLVAAAHLMHELRRLVRDLGSESAACVSRDVNYSDGRFHLPCGVPDYVTDGATA